MSQQWIHGFSPPVCRGLRLAGFFGRGRRSTRGAVQRSHGRLRGCQRTQVWIRASTTCRFSQRSSPIFRIQHYSERCGFEEGRSDQCQWYGGSSGSSSCCHFGYRVGGGVCGDGRRHDRIFDGRVLGRKK